MDYEGPKDVCPFNTGNVQVWNIAQYISYVGLCKELQVINSFCMSTLHSY
jgi:hypothetical protein